MQERNMHEPEKKGGRVDIPKLVVAILVCEAVGSSGSTFTFSAISTWYATLQKPWFTPPNWLFGPVWISLFFLMGVSLYLLWMKADAGSKRRLALYAFVFQFALNILWSYVFFGLRSYLGGLIEIILLWAAIGFTIAASYRVRRAAGLVLVPYIIWVTIAALLNYYVWLLNP